MNKEEIRERIKQINERLYNKFGTQSYEERCSLFDLATIIELSIDQESEKAFHAAREMIFRFQQQEAMYVDFADYQKSKLNKQQEK